MENNKFKKGLFFAFSIVVLLIFSSISTFETSADIFKKNDAIQKTDSYLKGTLTWIKTTSASVKIPTISYKGSKLSALADNFFINSNNIVVSDTTGNESYPSIVIEGNNGLVAYEYEDESETRIYIQNSENFGQSWSDAIKIKADLYDNQDIEINSPSLNLEPVVKKAYGACKSPIENSSVLGFFEIDDITDLNKINTYNFEFKGLPDGDDPTITYAFWGFKTPKIVAFKDPNTPPWFMVFIGTSNYTVQGKVEPFTNALLFLFPFKLEPEQGDALGMHPDHQNLSNLSISRYYDSSTKYICGICEINNGSNQDLFFFKLIVEIWDYNDDFIYQFLTSSENLTHPQIFVEENHIYIVADSDSSGIVLYSSSDDGDSWSINHVTRDIIPPSANPNYPLFYANDKYLFCSFIESGNIYLTKSTDYGLNWNVPVQLNDENGTVVEEYRFADFSDKNHVLWTDNREGNCDIYSDLVNFLPPSAPVIDGPTRGKKGVSFKFTFKSVDPDGDDVYYYIKWDDGYIENWNGPHISGTDFNINHTYQFEGVKTISAKAKDINGNESDWGTLNVTIPRTKPSNFKFNLLGWLFERFPLLEKLLSLFR